MIAMAITLLEEEKSSEHDIESAKARCALLCSSSP